MTGVLLPNVYKPFIFCLAWLIIIYECLHDLQKANTSARECVTVQQLIGLGILFFALGDASRIDFTGALKEYSNSRVLRVGAVHGMSGMAAISASTYKVHWC